MVIRLPNNFIEIKLILIPPQRAARSGNMSTAIRVEELLKKSEALSSELETTKAALTKLQKEHAKTKEEAKSACSKLHYTSMQVTTLRQGRDDAVSKLRRAQQNYETLNRTMTKQAAGWVQERIDERALERSNKIKRLLPNVAQA